MIALSSGHWSVDGQLSDVVGRGMTREQRAALCDVPVTLNGQRAKITGYLHPFAIVRQHRTGLSAEWSWDAVARIVAKGGVFRS